MMLQSLLGREIIVHAIVIVHPGMLVELHCMRHLSRALLNQIDKAAPAM